MASNKPSETLTQNELKNIIHLLERFLIKIWIIHPLIKKNTADNKNQEFTTDLYTASSNVGENPKRSYY